MDADGDNKVTVDELKHFIFEPVREEDLQKYNDVMEDPPKELCETVEPESVAGGVMLALGYFTGVCTFKGGCCCLGGIAALAYRLTKTQQGRKLVESKTVEL